MKVGYIDRYIIHKYSFVYLFSKQKDSVSEMN